MPPKLPKIVSKILERSKREAKDDSEVKSKKIDPDISRVMGKVKVRGISKDDSETAEAEKRKRQELITWAKKNPPQEGWRLTDNLIKEIKLRHKYLKESSKIPWLKYLEDSGLKITRKVESVKDDSGILGAKVKKLECAPQKKLAKDHKDFTNVFDKISELEEEIDKDYFYLLGKSKEITKNNDLNEYVTFLKEIISTLDGDDPVVKLTNQLIVKLNKFGPVNDDPQVLLTLEIGKITKNMDNLLRKAVNNLK